MLKGVSGKTYGNMLLLTTEEKAEAALDGVVDFVKPVIVPDPVAVAAREESQRISGIRSEVTKQIFGRTADVENDETDRGILKTLIKSFRATQLLNKKVDATITVEETTELDIILADTQNSLELYGMAVAAELSTDKPDKLRYDIEQAKGKSPKDQYALKPDPDNVGRYIEDIPVV